MFGEDVAEQLQRAGEEWMAAETAGVAFGFGKDIRGFGKRGRERALIGVNGIALLELQHRERPAGVPAAADGLAELLLLAAAAAQGVEARARFLAVEIS